MKGKKKNKKKVGKIILLGMSFLLTIVLTFTITLAWFYDSDWASKSVTMAGSVGIVIKDSGGVVKSGAGNLHFKISTDKAYPGQAVEVSASVYNDGERSGVGGSPAYIRAHFAVYTDVGKLPDPNHYNYGTTPTATITHPNLAYDTAVSKYKKAHGILASDSVETSILEAAGIVTSDYVGGLSSQAYIRDYAEAQEESELDSSALYDFLNNLIYTQNNTSSTKYQWKYYQHTSAIPISTSGTQKVGNDDSIDDTSANSDIKYYVDGASAKDSANLTSTSDRGYYYLCYKSGESFTTFTDSTAQGAITNTKGTYDTEDKTYTVGTDDFVLMPVSQGSEASFLWNDQFIIPWTLTNISADKHIFVAVSFQAVQTFIPQINTDGSFNKAANNQVAPELCSYDNNSLQAVFNSSYFAPISTIIRVYEDVNNDGEIDENDTIDFGDTTKYTQITRPTANSIIK